MPNGKSSGRRRSRRPKQNECTKEWDTIGNRTSHSFAFMNFSFSSVVPLVWMSAVSSHRYGNEYPRNDQSKTTIRTHLPQETGSDYIGLVPVAGLEPARSDPPHFECGASANSATPAYCILLLRKL